MNLPLVREPNQTEPVEGRQSEPRRVLVVLSEDDGQADWIANGEEVEVAVVWSYEGYEGVPKAFRDLALAYGFTPDEAGETMTLAERLKDATRVRFLWSHIFPGDNRETEVWATVDITAPAPRLLAARYTNGRILDRIDFENLEQALVDNFEMHSNGQGRQAWIGFLDEFCDESEVFTEGERDPGDVTDEEEDDKGS